MSKARSTGNLNNSIVISDTGAITFVSGSTTLATINTTGQISGSTSVKSAATASYADSFTVASTLTAQTLVVQTITSSVSVITGSTNFGTLSSNNHTFTGSINASGSATFSGSVGIGLTPYNNTIGPAFDMKNGVGMFGYGDAAYISGNLYFDGAWKVKNTGTGSQITLGGEITFNTTTTSTAGSTVTNTERMRITNAGFVGIGTSNPNTVLDVRKATADGDTQFNFINSTSSPASNTSATSTIYLGFYDSGTGLANANKIVSGKEGDYQSPASAKSFLAFYTTNANAYAEKMRIGSDGRVFIGIAGSSNGHKLELNAGSLTSALRIDVTSGNSAISISPGGSIGIDKPGVGGGAFKVYSNGDMLINTTDVDAGIGANVSSNQFSFPISTEGPRISTTGTWYLNFNSVGGAGIQRIIFRYSGASAGSIGVSSGAVSYNTSFSDVNMKKNFENWNENVLDKFAVINPQKFNFINQEDGSKKVKGFIAQEMVDKFPEAYQKPDGDFYSFNPSGMVVYLMKAIQELKAENDTLKEILQRNNIQ